MFKRKVNEACWFKMRRENVFKHLAQIENENNDSRRRLHLNEVTHFGDSYSFKNEYLIFYRHFFYIILS